MKNTYRGVNEKRLCCLSGICVILIVFSSGCKLEAGTDSKEDKSTINQPKSDNVPRAVEKPTEPEAMSENKNQKPDEVRRMKSQLSSRAKKQVLLADPDKQISVLITVAGSVDREKLTADTEEIGGHVVSWSEKTNLVNATVPAGALETLAGFEGVTYIDVGGKFGSN